MEVELDLTDVKSKLGNNGVVLKIYKPGSERAYMGDLRIGRATVSWRKKGQPEKNRREIDLDELIEIFERRA